MFARIVKIQRKFVSLRDIEKFFSASECTTISKAKVPPLKLKSLGNLLHDPFSTFYSSLNKAVPDDVNLRNLKSLLDIVEIQTFLGKNFSSSSSSSRRRNNRLSFETRPLKNCRIFSQENFIQLRTLADTFSKIQTFLGKLFPRMSPQ